MKNSTNQLLTLLLYLVLFVASSILSLTGVTGHIYFGIVTTLSILLAVSMIYLVHKNGPNEIERPKFDWHSAVTWTLIGSIGAIVLQLIIMTIESFVFHTQSSSQNTMTLLTAVHGYPYYLVYILIGAPIMEEIAFRRVFFANLIKPTNIYWAAIISSILFAFLHQDTRFVVYIAMGLWFCFVYYRSKNIYVSAASHIVMNAVVFWLSIV